MFVELIVDYHSLERFLITAETVIHIGVNFSTEKRNIAYWQVVDRRKKEDKTRERRWKVSPFFFHIKALTER